MLNILAIHTGGTISSKNCNGIIKLNEEEYNIIEKYKQKYNSDGLKFFNVQPYSILSENLNIRYINLLIKCLKDQKIEKYDGVIIFHGTDTLAYTANIIGILLGNVGLPVVFVSSNNPIEQVNSNGLENLDIAITLIKEKISGVFVAYRQNDENIVHLATRITQASYYTDNFYSFGNIPFGVVKNNKFVLNTSKDNIDINLIGEKRSIFKNTDNIDLCDDILLINSSINIDYNSIDINNRRAVCICTFHSGTVNTEVNSKNSVLSLLQKCEDRRIPLYIFPIKTEQLQNNYQSLECLKNRKVRFICDESVESAYAKLLIIYSLNLNDKEIKNMLEEDIFFEKLK